MLALTRVPQPLKWWGGKRYPASRILELMPSHLHYVEPFAGGLAVLLAKDPEGVSEVVNDLHGGLTNFWRVLQGEETFARFGRIVETMPFGEAEYERAVRSLKGSDGDPVQRAVWFFVACRQLLAGRMMSFTGVTKTRTRRGTNNEVSAWLTAVEGLPAVHDRLKRVLILNRPALDAIRKEDGPSTLLYCDPPYLHETREAPDAYRHEMTAEQHRGLLEVLKAVKGKVMLSGYPSAMYDDALSGWIRHEYDLPNHAAGGDSKRRMTECLWCNF